jgi:hypothetical protein
MKSKSKLSKLKRLPLLLLLPVLLATTCEDDNSTGFETTYYIQNDASEDLFFLTEVNDFILIESQSTFQLGSDLNSETEAIPPTESFIFSEIKLYKMLDDNFILVYTQDPINNDLWLLNEPSENRFDYNLVITDELLD